MVNILESTYVYQTRPYSQNELKNIRLNLFQNLKIGNLMAHHRCGHIYFVKQNGKKEKEMLEKKSKNVGKCSVCWKISKTPVELRIKACNLADEYYNVFNQNTDFFSYRKVELENSFYKWLYTE
jgi:hypothetical protein